MAKTLAAILAVSIATLLAGCGGSGLSPAQQEVCDQLNAKKKAIEAKIDDHNQLYPGNDGRLAYDRELQASLKERAAASC